MVFGKVRSATKRIKTNVEKAQAKWRGMDVAELREEKARLHQRRVAEEGEFREWKLGEEYYQKRRKIERRFDQGGSGGMGITDKFLGLASNVSKNIEQDMRQSRGEDLAQILGVSSGKKKQKRRKR